MRQRRGQNLLQSCQRASAGLKNSVVTNMSGADIVISIGMAYTRVRELSKNYQKDHKTGDPAPELVCVDDLVSEQRHDECGDGDYDNTTVTRQIVVHWHAAAGAPTMVLTEDQPMHARILRTATDIKVNKTISKMRVNVYALIFTP